MFAPPDPIKFPLSRRQVLRSAGAGFGHLALAGLLGQAARASGAPAAQPLAARPPHFKPKATRIIFLFMQGAISQVDTFEYKPKLQQNGGKPGPGGGILTASKFGFRQHGESGGVVFRAHAAHGRARRQALLASGPLHRHTGAPAGCRAVAHRQRECRSHAAEHGRVDLVRPWDRESRLTRIRHHQPAPQLRRGRELWERISAGSLPGHTN